jgi:hypothetical protein
VTGNDGEPSISYYHVTLGDLRFAHRNSVDGWEITTVDAAGDVGSSSRITLDGSGRPYILYYHRDNQDLMMAHRPNTAWGVDTVAAQGDVGQYQSLKVDSAGRIQVLYYDGTTHDLHYASGSGSVTAVDETPPSFRPLLLVHPNPGVASTILLQLARPGPTQVRIFDVTGRLVRTVFEGNLDAGPHQFRWNGFNDAGQRTASGRYLILASTPTARMTKGIVVLR